MNSAQKMGVLIAAFGIAVLSRGARANETWHTYTHGYGSTSNITGGINLNVTRTVGSPLSFSSLAYCVDRYSDIPGSSSVYVPQATRDPATSYYGNSVQPEWLNTPNSQADTAAEWGRVSYIYHHYGMNAGGVATDQAFATQLAIWDVLGELAANVSHGDAALDPHAYGTGIANMYDNMLSSSLGQSEAAYFVPRTAVDNLPGQALITDVASTVPEGNSAWTLALGIFSLFGALRLRQSRYALQRK